MKHRWKIELKESLMGEETRQSPNLTAVHRQNHQETHAQGWRLNNRK